MVYWPLFILSKLDEHFDILPEVGLGANKQNRRLRAVPTDLGHPLLPHILERGGTYHTEAKQEDISIGVAQRPELIKFILPGDKKESAVINIKAVQLGLN